MTQNNDDVKLLPCPMCKAGETHSQGKYIGGPTMSGKPQEPYSWEIRHWCENKDGKLPRTFITVTGRDEKQAVSAWNTRASIPSPANEGERLEDVVDEYLHWRRTNKHIKGGGNYLSRLRKALVQAGALRQDMEGSACTAGAETFKAECSNESSPSTNQSPTNEAGHE